MAKGKKGKPVLVTPIVIPPSGGETYPASVAANQLQTVWDLRRNGRSTPGPRTATTKTLGVDNLPGGNTSAGTNCTYDGTFLTITGSQTFSNWNFDIAALREVIVKGNTSVVVFNDCTFGNIANDAGAAYGLLVSDNSTTPNVTCNYCTFDGHKLNGPGWGSSAVYVNTGATLTCDHCRFRGIPFDVAKTLNATYVQTWCLIEAFPWETVTSDADGVQMISGTVTVDHCLYDISEGLASTINDHLNSTLFCTIDTPSTQNGTPTVTNNIFYGYGLYSSGTLPAYVVSVADNHTATGNGFHIVNGVWQNNVMQQANAGYHTHGGTETSAVSIATWTRNIDFDTSATIAAPSF